jgi:16S rRNA (guanine(1405)-N(7))-methyltransferase
MGHKDFIEKVKEKKELRNIDDKFIEDVINKLKIDVSIIKIDHPKTYKEELKAVRKELRRKYGLFITKEAKKKDIIIEHLKNGENLRELCIKMLKTHRSSKERLEFYSEIYNKIFSKVDKISSVMDLACGMNPFSYIFIPEYKEKKYICVELNQADCKTINEFFKASGLKGKAVSMDLSKKENINKLPKADVSLLFKMITTIEEKEWILEELIKSLKSRYIIVSLPTRTISGKKMKTTGIWINEMAEKLGYKTENFEVENEIFYIITK